jgi:O-acetylserine/cysteine efflux transporter
MKTECAAAAGAVLIMAGLYINVFGLRVRRATRVKG